MTAEALDKENALKIARKLNSLQANSEPPIDTPWWMRNVWNLSDFGFAYVITQVVPSRYLRRRALTKLAQMTKNDIVISQIHNYLENDSKWDSHSQDNCVFVI